MSRVRVNDENGLLGKNGLVMIRNTPLYFEKSYFAVFILKYGNLAFLLCLLLTLITRKFENVTKRSQIGVSFR